MDEENIITTIEAHKEAIELVKQEEWNFEWDEICLICEAVESLPTIIEVLKDYERALENTTGILERQGQDILDKHEGLLLPRHVEADLKEIAIAVGEATKALSAGKNKLGGGK